jgi:hypothetical protein
VIHRQSEKAETAAEQEEERNDPGFDAVVENEGSYPPSPWKEPFLTSEREPRGYHKKSHIPSWLTPNIWALYDARRSAIVGSACT